MQKTYWIKHTALFLLAITFVACSARNRTKKIDCISINSGELIQKVYQNALNFDWYSSKINVKLKAPKDNSQDFKASIRIRKDSAIWSSVKVMSIPVALTIISEDSIKSLIKQPKKKYLAAETDYLKDRFNVDADYFAFQDILSGKPILFNKEFNYIAKCVDNQLWLMSHTEKQAEKALKKRQDDETYIVKYLINKETFVVEKIEALKIVDGSRLIVNYNEFESIEEQLIPTKTTAYFYGIKDTVQLDFESSKIKLNIPSDMPFNVTDSYEPIILE